MKPEAYTRMQRVLHWLTAALVFALLAIGTAMTSGQMQIATTFTLYQLHKSLGATVLALTLMRLARRIRHQPTTSGNSARWRMQGAAFVHGALYGLLVALPVTGWLVASASPIPVPFMLFGLLEVPPLPVLATLPDAAKIIAFGSLAQLHRLLAWTFAGLITAHIVGALVPQAHRAVVLGRMWGGPAS